MKVILVKPCETCGALIVKPPSCSVANWPKRRYCSRRCRADAMRGRSIPWLEGKRRGGPSWSSERREYMRQVMLDQFAEGRVATNTGLRGPETSQWKGDDITYRTAHARLYVQRGRPESCDHCGRSDGRLEWALKREASAVRVQEGGRHGGRRFSPRPDDYFSLCSGCHIVYDERQRTLEGRFK